MAESLRFPFIDEVCAHLSDADLTAAHERFARYLDILAAIAEREIAAGVDSTAPGRAPYDEGHPHRL